MGAEMASICAFQSNGKDALLSENHIWFVDDALSS